MFKLTRNEVPTWIINGTNTEFKTSKIIWTIQSVVVDWISVTWFTWENLTISLSVAPSTTITVNYFYVDVPLLRGNWLVTLWDLKISFYRKIWRVNDDLSIPANINKLYPPEYVKEELLKSYKRITNRTPETNRIQQYTTIWRNWYIVTWSISEDTITLENSLTTDIAWIFYVWNWISYDYYSIAWWLYQVKWVDVSAVGDKLITWNKIPYWVKKITEVISDWVELSYIDEREYFMWNDYNYSITKDWQGNSYLLLPYAVDTVDTVVKYIPDMNYFSTDTDIVDIDEEYMDVIVYDTTYRLLKDKEDERWVDFKNELWDWRKQWLLYEYQSSVKSQIKKTRARIWFANTY